MNNSIAMVWLLLLHACFVRNNDFTSAELCTLPVFVFNQFHCLIKHLKSWDRKQFLTGLRQLFYAEFFALFFQHFQTYSVVVKRVRNCKKQQFCKDFTINFTCLYKNKCNHSKQKAINETFHRQPIQ